MRVAPGDASRFITRLASAVHGYRAVLYAYLAEKEKVLVPTLRAFFTPEEVFAAFAEVLRKTPRAAFGSLVHHLAGGEEAVKAFNARSVVSRSWRFGYGETVKHRAEYRAKMEFLLERLLAGDARLGKNKSAFGATFPKTTLERVNALTPLDLNERLVVNPTSSEALALAIADELGPAGASSPARTSPGAGPARRKPGWSTSPSASEEKRRGKYKIPARRRRVPPANAPSSARCDSCHRRSAKRTRFCGYYEGSYKVRNRPRAFPH